ncbi:flagellar biosynthesis protein FlhF [Bacillus sp. EB600]|uniref:flagellar biosynthesis protein FlhF n=1 Tax=Bacillus sp. EB600 TaxID=2806345 RepID=UPI002109B956|nr:flagellar biosynthesis protein FlhF [Bacillus sp. EB600]MCQ6280182.1 flagellar biosynthesis protein FlhF [Bacillus sp. EB600]
MKVKKFTAKSMPDAMKSVRNELGNEAVILNSRIVYTSGFLGFFRKKNIEIIAAVDQVAKHESKPILKEKQPSFVPIPNKQTQTQLDNQRDIIKESPLQSNQSADILKEISNIKELIQSQSFQSAQIQGIYPEPVQKLLDWMNEQEFSASLMEKYTAGLMEKWFAAGMNCSAEELRGFLKEEILKYLNDKPFGGITFTKKFVNVIGPTGVGKTTTLAKIAAECILNHHKKVAFITTDTYRIAAIEQLKTYAQILNIPLEVCYTLEDFQGAVKKFAPYDVVLIDTAGRNFRNKQYVNELSRVIDFTIDIQTYLVLALTGKQKDMEAIFQQFSSIKIDKFIFTKADETAVFGSMMNMIEKYEIGVAYITTGQNVPDDVMIASPNTITNLLIGAK